MDYMVASRLVYTETLAQKKRGEEGTGEAKKEVWGKIDKC